MKKTAIILSGFLFFTLLTQVSSNIFQASLDLQLAAVTAVGEEEPILLAPDALTLSVQSLTSRLLKPDDPLVAADGKLAISHVAPSVRIDSKKQTALERKKLMLELAKKNPRAFIANSIRAADRATLPIEVRPYVETQVTTQGTVIVLHIDDFENPDNSRFEYTFKVGSQSLEFYPTTELHMISGTTLKVTGVKLDNVLAVDSEFGSNKITVVGNIPVPESTGLQRTLILLVEFTDSGPRPFTPEEAQKIIFDGQFQKFYKEQSYNQVSFVGDVLGWFKVNHTGNNKNACDPTVFTRQDFESLISAQNVNLSNYDRVVTALNGNTGGCSEVGKSSYVSGSTTYRISKAWIGLNNKSLTKSFYPVGHSFEWKYVDYVLSHEIGHSLGVMHANAWDCENQPLYGNCQHREYGNQFDVMGFQFASLHFNGFYKELLGWINATSTISIKQSGKYVLAPLESLSGKRVAKIQMLGSTSTPFYLEYRRPIGFDSSLSNALFSKNNSGLQVNQIIRSSFFPFTRLIDVSTNAGIYYDIDSRDPVVTKTATLLDPDTGILIGPVISTTASGILFDVRLYPPQCVRRVPIIDSIQYSQEVALQPYGVVNVNFKAVNTEGNGCALSTFRIVPEFPSGWTVYNPLNDFLLTPTSNIVGDPYNGYKFFDIKVPDYTSSGVYPLKITLLNVTSGKQDSRSFSVNVLEKLILKSIDPPKSEFGSSVIIKGSGFSGKGALNIQLTNTEGYTKLPVTLIDNETASSTIPRGLYLISKNCNQDGTCPSIPASLGFYNVHLQSSKGMIAGPLEFEIVPPASSTPFSVIYPNGGERLAKNSNIIVRWATGQGGSSATMSIIARSQGFGDVNMDGTVSIADYIDFLSAYNSRRGDAKYNENADFNNDDSVSIADQLIISENYNKTIDKVLVATTTNDGAESINTSSLPVGRAKIKILLSNGTSDWSDDFFTIQTSVSTTTALRLPFGAVYQSIKNLLSHF